jgi:hypothetical protein
MGTAPMHTNKRSLSDDFSRPKKKPVLSYESGDLRVIGGHEYVTHSGLLKIAHTRNCNGIHTEVVTEVCDAANRRWVLKAIVYPTARSKGFVGIGDADPSNVSPLLHGAEMRVAETRAVNRALRKAYGIGICSVEELSSTHFDPRSVSQKDEQGRNGHEPIGERPLRDRLFALIRQHELDPTLVKRFALDFCGKETLRQASRKKIESFVNHLAKAAAEDRESLLRRLEQYKDKEAA